ncbi:MAG: LysR family transcriptional regulator [Paracoccus sp. (in: a-proteobacteria)]|nr:LysR family transcriptional regulator [Paracoccus sp. (in: a-proteobacteria)]
MTDAPDNPQNPPPRIKLRLDYGPALTLGPGKADLLAGIAELGSISAAGRRMGMSYKRAWSLVEEMNAGFAQPLVDSARGGAGGGGAMLTETGAQVLAHFRALESLIEQAGADRIAAITGLLADMSARK